MGDLPLCLSNFYTMFCKNCGKELADNAIICPNCGAPQNQNRQVVVDNVSPKNGVVTVLLCFVLGGLGVHSFYAGNIVAGIIQLLTLGCCGIWTFVDFILILVGSYKDGEGKIIKL